MTNWPEQLFVLSNEALEATAFEDVAATAIAMQDAGVWKPPYRAFAVLINGKHFLNPGKGDWEKFPGGLEAATSEIKGYDLRLHFRDVNDEALPVQVYIDTHDGKGFHNVTEVFGPLPHFIEAVNAAYIQLLVLLATRNATKTVVEDKLVKLGIGKSSKKRFRYTTTITVGAIDEHEDGSPVGRGEPRRPHFRRGHVRRQKYGPGWQFERKIFVEAVFVNADREWVGERDHYNVRMEK